ncbi:hypothetical protein [Shewanella psychrotolerans]|uniref:hypothetical protein n=1 Tax=Shewanella psychrotolerans TaxID=2864206 RepID=UPI001C658504|nr:hypothetical protein [Shewanella psychrotolerans]QYK01691.1 hypothetical protein K0I62_01505 [Shewanella psychrotolerans]
MLKKWILVLLPALLIGVTGCASTNDEENQTDDQSVTKTSKDCQKVKTTGSRLSRCNR